jgi:hypothetical protein
MIAFMELDLKRIASGDPDYCWPRPSRCGRCKNPTLWSHGLVAVIFARFAQALWIRRYRCPACGCIIRLRPKGYFTRHQSDIATIRKTLLTRLNSGCWPRNGVTSRAGHWLRALKRQVLAVLGVPAMADLIAAFDRLIVLGRVPVSRVV